MLEESAHNASCSPALLDFILAGGEALMSQVVDYTLLLTDESVQVLHIVL